MALTISGFGGVTEATPPYTIVSWSTGTTAEIGSMLQAAEDDLINIGDYWSIGQERTVSGINWTLTDFDGTTSGGTKYNCIIHSKVITETAQMNSSNTNVGGWNSSLMRTSKMSSIYSSLDGGFKSLIKQVSNISGAGNASDTTQTTSDYIWLFSEREVQGTKTYSGQQEYNACKQFKYFETSSNKVKTLNGSAYYWWLRSPYVSTSNSFCYVSSDGSPNYSTAYDSCGVVPAAAI